MKIIVSGYVDGILGVACLNVLEKAIDKVLVAGVPSYAVPLHSGDCKNTTLDEAWIWEVLDRYEPLTGPGRDSYIPLLRTAERLFEPDRLDALVPPPTPDGFAAFEQTAGSAREFLAHGGKRFRPFITLAAHDAATGGEALTAKEEEIVVPPVGRPGRDRHRGVSQGEPRPRRHSGRRHPPLRPAGAARLARGRPGDQLRRLADRAGLPSCWRTPRTTDGGSPAVSAELTAAMADAHQKLCDGQGAEMAWRADPDPRRSNRWTPCRCTP